jgi:hypothetical protein
MVRDAAERQERNCRNDAHFGILLASVLDHGLDQCVLDVPAIASLARGLTRARKAELQNAWCKPGVSRFL